MTQRELTKLYLDGWMPRGDWKVGTPLIWEISVEGVIEQAAKGMLMACLPGRRLRYTIYKPDNKLKDIPANYTTVDIVLDEEKDGRTRVTLWQGDFAGLPDEVRRARAAGRKWVESLVGLKRVSEEQEQLKAA